MSRTKQTCRRRIQSHPTQGLKKWTDTSLNPPPPPVPQLAPSAPTVINSKSQGVYEKHPGKSKKTQVRKVKRKKKVN
jgi:hypothetical protein